MPQATYCISSLRARAVTFHSGFTGLRNLWVNLLVTYGLPPREFHCPFCEKTSSRPQGLAAHIRIGHPKQNPKWLKTPSRLLDAQNTAGAPEAATTAPELPAQPHAVHGEGPVSLPPALKVNPALDLLKKAHVQLIDRKQSLEGDIARLADLTKELETVNTQIQALDQALGVFEPRP